MLDTHLNAMTDGFVIFLRYETENQISHQESGIARSEEEPVIVSGSYSYKAPNGEILKVTYTADENGFQPQGEHLPVAPPVPEEILRVSFNQDSTYKNF